MKQSTLARRLKTADIPAAFRRLCVETKAELTKELFELVQPPSGGCVLKPKKLFIYTCTDKSSRLQAAVC